MLQFRDLTENDIEVRVGQAKENGVSLLLYKNARCDMNILDETLGCENWQREHYECKGNLFCKIGINTNFKDNNLPPNWIWKSDCGTESNTEAQKAEASDSFKRSAVNIGIGRELYSAPFIWVDKSNVKTLQKITVKGKDIYRTNDKFAVEKIVIENKRIIAISIINTTLKKRVFVWQKEADK